MLSHFSQIWKLSTQFKENRRMLALLGVTEERFGSKGDKERGENREFGFNLI